MAVPGRMPDTRLDPDPDQRRRASGGPRRWSAPGSRQIALLLAALVVVALLWVLV